jgi:hypothetical protein
MEKEFIPYEQALALKELGFDEPCFGYYLDEKLNIFHSTSENDRINSKTIEIFSSDVITSPTFSQAFRWFRKKYNIQGYIYSSTVRGNSEKTKQFTGYIWNINGIDMPFISTDARDELHDTYEEAELKCLKKLIKIVKQK